MRGGPNKLPELLAEIAEVAGIDAALAVAQAKGGARAHFPHPNHLRDGHWLVCAVGIEKARLISKHFSSLTAGIYLHIALGPAGMYQIARLKAEKMRASGATISATARACGVTTRTIEKWTSNGRGGVVGSNKAAPSVPAGGQNSYDGR